MLYVSFFINYVLGVVVYKIMQKFRQPNNLNRGLFSSRHLLVLDDVCCTADVRNWEVLLCYSFICIFHFGSYYLFLLPLLLEFKMLLRFSYEIFMTACS